MGSIKRRHFLALGGAGLAAAAVLGAQTTAQAEERGTGMKFRYFPQGKRFRQLYVLDSGTLSAPEGVLVGTLQGLVARERSQQPVVADGLPGIYLTTAKSSPTTLWLDDLERQYGVETTKITDIWELVAAYRPRHGGAGITGYVLYQDDPSVSVATTLSGLTGSVAVHASLQEQAEAAGLVQTADVRGKDDAWLTRTHGDRVRRDLAIEQRPSIGPQLRDLATLAGAQVFFDGNSDYRADLVSRLEPDSPVIGWGDAANGEVEFVSMSSKVGTFEVAADWAANVSTLSGVPAPESLQQRGGRRTQRAESGVHYVTFVITDGDNVQWLLTGLQNDQKWWANPDRGSLPIGWGMAPTMIDLAPSVLRWYYHDASHNDEFVVGPSGSGYFYPSQYPAEVLDTATDRLAAYMQRTDLGVVQILDFDALDRTEVWDSYTRHREIDGLFYLDYDRYDGMDGKIVWSHDKPVISARHALWDGLDGADEASVTAAINAAARDPHSADGYTMVTVHAWSKDLAAIQKVVAGLADDVRVVAPGAFTRLVAENVGH